MKKMAERVAKLENRAASREPLRRIERHIVDELDRDDREARIAAILASSEGNVLHIFRTIILPGV